MPQLLIRDGLVRGGFAEVYRGVLMQGSSAPRRDVAVHLLRVRYEPGHPLFDRVERDATLLAGIRHPSLVQIHDLVSIDGRAALITERTQGRDLADLLRSRDIPRRVVFEAVAQISSAVAAAWSSTSPLDGKPLRRVHRGIHPGVIRITPEGYARLSDFGIVPTQDPNDASSQGHLRYQAPEVLVQRWSDPSPGGHSHESDVFALGCTLFEALTSRRLFGNLAARELRAIMADESQYRQYVNQLLAENRPHLGSDRGVALVRAMVAFRKGERPAAAEVAARCDLISDGIPGPTLTSWCQNRTWPDPRAVGGPLVGRQVELTRPPLQERTAQRSAPPRRTAPPPPPRAPRTDRRDPVLGEVGHPPIASHNASAMVAAGPMPYSRDELLALFGTLHGADPAEPPEPPPGVHVDPNRQPQLVRQRVDGKGPSRRVSRRAIPVVLAEAVAHPSYADDEEDVPTEIVDPDAPRIAQPPRAPAKDLRIPTVVPPEDAETQRFDPPGPPAVLSSAVLDDLVDMADEDTPPPPVYRTFGSGTELQAPEIPSPPAPAPNPEGPPLVPSTPAPPVQSHTPAQGIIPAALPPLPEPEVAATEEGRPPAAALVEAIPVAARAAAAAPPPSEPGTWAESSPAPVVPPFGRRPGELVVPEPVPLEVAGPGPRPLTLFLATFFGLLVAVPTLGLIAATAYYALQP